MTEKLVEVLASQGVLGVICVVLILAIAQMWKENKKIWEDRQKEIVAASDKTAEIQKEHLRQLLIMQKDNADYLAGTVSKTTEAMVHMTAALGSLQKQVEDVHDEFRR